MSKYIYINKGVEDEEKQRRRTNTRMTSDEIKDFTEKYEINRRMFKMCKIVIMLLCCISMLKGQDTNVLPSDYPILLDEMSNHRKSMQLGVEIIPYKVVPSDNPLYGCWSELDVIWPDYMSDEIKERLVITIINQELHQDIPDMVEINDDGLMKSYYMIKLPIGHYWNVNGSSN